MPATERSFAASTPKDTKVRKFPSAGEEVAAPEFETNPFHATPIMGQNLTRSNILNLQRTVGNQAVLRILENRQAGKSTMRAEGPFQTVQRKFVNSAFKNTGSTFTGKWVDSTWTRLRSVYNKYQTAPAEEELPYLAQLRKLANDWIIKHGKMKSKTDTNRMLVIIGFRDDIDNEIKSKLSTLAAKIGLAMSYLNELLDNPLNPLKYVALADSFLEQGLVGKADAALVQLKEVLPDTFPIIKGALIRAHIGAINPQMAELINNQKYRQKDEESAKKGEHAYQQYSTTDHVGDYKTKAKNSRKIDPRLTGQELEKKKALKTQYSKEKKFANLKIIDKMSSRDLTSITNYSGKDYDDINASLRNMNLGGTEKTIGPTDKTGLDGMIKYGLEIDNKGKFNDAKLGFTQNTVSALNKLPPYKGEVYRHDKLFKGFEEVYREGAVVSDMAFMSTTYMPSSLLPNFGKDIVSIITSKTGRFIKPMSANDYEDEVLFKPGTKFMIKKVIKAQLDGNDPTFRGWPADLDAKIKAVLDADRVGKEIKYVVIREEV